MAAPGTGAPLMQAGKIKPLATTAMKRLPDYPNVPTVAESGVPGYELSNIYMLYVQGATPAAILTGLNREVALALTDPELRKKFAAVSTTPGEPYSPDELRKNLAAEIARWEVLIKKGNIKLDD